MLTRELSVPSSDNMIPASAERKAVMIYLAMVHDQMFGKTLRKS